MQTKRAILTGSLIWLSIAIAFTTLSFAPAVMNSQLLQGLIIGSILIPASTLGAFIYFKKEKRTSGFKIGIVMAITALALDVFITVPFFEIPLNGGSYATFFSNPLLWILIIENILVVHIYWSLRVKPSLK